MAPQHAVLGSSPTVSRSSTPQPQRGGSVKSTVVPFVRRCSGDQKDGSRLESRFSFEGGRARPGSTFSGFGIDERLSRSPGGSSLSSRSLPTLRRPEFAPLHVQRGFAPASQRPPANPPQQQPRRSGSGAPASAAGLLTRQLSSNDVQPVGQRPSQTELQKALEKCLDKAAVTPPSEQKQLQQRHGSVPAADHLEQLRERHAVFGAPVVSRAYGVASATLAADRLAANGAAAAILADLGLDADTVAAALLRDALDASPLTRQQLEMLVPPAVADMVANVSRISSACQLVQADSAAQDPSTAAKLTTMLLAMADVRAVLVVLASRLAALRAAAALAAAGGADLRAEAEEGLRVFAPLANRLGVWSLKAELEDLCFLVLHPKRAKELRDMLAQLQSRAGLASALTQLKARLDAAGLAYEDLSGRPKNLYGVHSKLARKGLSGAADLGQVYDVRALRLIVGSKQDCYAALREVERLWPSVPGRFKDYVRTPKANGYQSLHTVVTGPDGLPIEVQIRTAKMHYIAEYGVAAHWRYKEKLGNGGDGGAHTDQLIGWARWLITWKLELEDGKTRPRGSPPRDTSLASLLGARAPSVPLPRGLPGSGDVAGGETQVAGAPAGGCTFPEHHPDCRFAKYVRSERFAPRATPDDLASPVYLVLLNATKAAAAANAAASSAAAAPAAAAAAAGSSAVAAGSSAAAALQRSISGAFDAPGAALPVVALPPPPLEPSIETVPAGTTVAGLLAAAGLAANEARVLVNHEVVTDGLLLLRHGDKVEMFDADPVEAAPPAPARSNVLPFLRKAAAADAAASAGAPAAAAAGTAAARAEPASPKPPDSPSRAIPSLGPRPAFTRQRSAGGADALSGGKPHVSFGDAARGTTFGGAFAADGGYDAGPATAATFAADGAYDAGAYGDAGFDDALPAQRNYCDGWGGSPVGETAHERKARMARQRNLLDRAFSRSASERLDAIMARPDFLPPEMRGSAPSAPLAAG